MILNSITLVFIIGLTGTTVESGFAPALPTGRRTQYYYLYENGGYKYGYDTGSGIYSKAVASPDNEVQGDYSYQGPAGKIDVKYTAGVGGFQPNNIPANTGTPSNEAISPPAQRIYPSSVYSAEDEEKPGDASYSFSYNTGDQSRNEVSDQQGNVQGSFSYVGVDGNTRKIDYEAGAEKGFIAKGDHLPQPVTPLIPSSNAGNYDQFGSVVVLGQVQPSYQLGNGMNNQQGMLSQGVHTPTIYSPKVIQHAHTYQALPAQSYYGSQVNQQPLPDGSYSFSYNAGDHSRSESSDSQGNVVGSFSFTAKDNVNRKLTYEAGAEKGFIARGDHLPKLPTSYQSPYGSTAGVTVVTNPNLWVSQIAGATSPSTSDMSNDNADASYSFSYNAGDHSRQESSDSMGNVHGTFKFIAKDDGIERKVDYEAGAEKGFIAAGSHLPTQSQTGISMPVSQIATSGNSQINRGQNDASYSFAYNAGDHSRQESSDSAGNVVGSYSFISKDDGMNRKVDYKSGSDIGFVASGIHLPTTPLPLTSNAYNQVRINLAGTRDQAVFQDQTVKTYLENSGTISSGVNKPYTNDKAIIKTFLIPNSHHKFGYLYDSVA